MALYLDLKPGDILDVDSSRVMITLEEKTGSVMRVKVDADRSIPVKKVSQKTSRHVASMNGLSPRA